MKRTNRHSSGDALHKARVPAHVAAVVRSGGKPLDAATRTAMEERFGESLTDVRLHTGAAAAQSARALSARAYALGRHVVFGPEGYAPHRPESRERLAHELTHVVQQSRGSGVDLAPAQREVEAREAARSVAGEGPMPQISAAAPAISCDDGAGALPPIPDVTLPRPSLLGPAEGAATLDGFAFGKAELTESHRKRLAELAVRLKRLLAEPPGGRVMAIGHTDKVGSEKGNEALGQQRADAVRDALVGPGIDATGIHTDSLGESVPAVDTPNAEPRNRRVEVYFAPASGPKYPGIFTEGLKRPEPLRSTPPPKVPGISTRIDYCKVFPEQCDPNRLPPDFYKPIPELPKRKPPSLTETVWNPIDKALERGLRKLGISDTWNKRLRDAARAGAEKGATEILDQAMDAANLTGETREAVGAALRAAAQQQIPFE